MIALFGIGLAGLLLVLSAAHALGDPPSENAPEGKADGFPSTLLFMLVLIGVIAHHMKRKREDDE